MFISLIESLTYTKSIISFGKIQSIANFYETFFEENQWWRLVTPIFIHFDLVHLAFNCLWIYILGKKIERIDGKVIFICIVIFSAIASNSLQYYWTGFPNFGGLSGVVYGLLAFCMILEMESKYQRYDLPPALYLFMIFWLILGFLGILELFTFSKIANFAHLGGLVSGMMFGMMYKYYKKIS